MPKDTPCPNPGCGFLFPAAAVVGVAALVCPKCGGVFQVKAKRPAPGQVLPMLPRPPVRSMPRAWVWAGLVIFVGIGLMTAVIYRQSDPPAKGGPEPYRSTEHNYSMLLPGPPWQRDEALAKQLGGVLAFRRDNPEAEAAVVVRQYPKFVPTIAELREEAVARLRKYPVDNLQREDKSEGATLAGLPAGRIVFLGTIDGVLVSGDVQFLTHQGAAYWLYRWCPAAAVEQTAADLADLAERFGLLNLHADWQPPRRTFSGTKAKYTLTAEGERWEKAPYPPENYDPAADLALIGNPQDGPADPARQAQLLVVGLPAGNGDAVQRAKSHLLERHKEVYPETTATDLPAGDEKPSAEKGAGPVKVVALQVKDTKDRERFVVLGVVPRKDGPLVVWAECDFSRRAMWEADFRKFVGSFTLDKD
jgi:hypothetical protein